MGSKLHTYGPSCQLQYGSFSSNLSSRRPSTISDEIPPRINIQFFYSSSLPIDNPLAIAPTTTTPSRVYLPFSAHDNGRLEEAWQNYMQIGGEAGLVDEIRRKKTTTSLKQPQTSTTSRFETDISALQHYRFKGDGKGLHSGELFESSPLATFSEGSHVESTDRSRRQWVGSKVEGLRKRVEYGVRSISPSKAQRLAQENQGSRDVKGSILRKSRPDQEQGDVSTKFMTKEPGNDQQQQGCDAGPLSVEGKGSEQKDNRQLEDYPANTALDHNHVATSILLSDEPEHSKDWMSPIDPSELGIGPSPRTPPQTPSLPPRSAGSATQRLSESFKHESQYGSSPAERDTTGNPFQRAVSPRTSFTSPRRPTQQLQDETDANVIESPDEDSIRSSGLSGSSARRSTTVSEPVGLSRLHIVDISTFEV